MWTKLSVSYDNISWKRRRIQMISAMFHEAPHHHHITTQSNKTLFVLCQSNTSSISPEWLDQHLQQHCSQINVDSKSEMTWGLPPETRLSYEYNDASKLIRRLHLYLPSLLVEPPMCSVAHFSHQKIKVLTWSNSYILVLFVTLQMIEVVMRPKFRFGSVVLWQV